MGVRQSLCQLGAGREQIEHRQDRFESISASSCRWRRCSPPSCAESWAISELGNTLQRAALWSTGAIIDADDVREALLLHPEPAERPVLGRALGDGLDLRELMSEVARHYLSRALDEAGGNKTRAAELVGLPSYQTLTNWLERYGVEGPQGGIV